MRKGRRTDNLPTGFKRPELFAGCVVVLCLCLLPLFARATAVSVHDASPRSVILRPDVWLSAPSRKPQQEAAGNKFVSEANEDAAHAIHGDPKHPNPAFRENHNASAVELPDNVVALRKQPGSSGTIHRDATGTPPRNLADPVEQAFATPAAPPKAGQDTTPLVGGTPASVTMGVFVVVGMVLVFLGRRLAKLAVALVGLFYGVVLAITASELFGTAPTWLFLIVVAGGLIGLALTHVLFRFWTTVGTGLILAYLAPALMLAAINAQWIDWPAANEGSDQLNEWQSESERLAQKAKETADQAQKAKQAMDSVKQNLDEMENDTGLGSVFSDLLNKEDEGEDEATDNADASSNEVANAKSDDQPDNTDGMLSQANDAGHALLGWLKTGGASLRQMYQAETAHLHGWWAESGQGHGTQLMTAAGIGLAVGLVVGLFMPTFAVALQTALIGAVLLTLPGRTLVEHHLGHVPTWLPHTPRMVLLTVCLITMAGVIFQCSVKRKASDD